MMARKPIQPSFVEYPTDGYGIYDEVSTMEPGDRILIACGPRRTASLPHRLNKRFPETKWSQSRIDAPEGYTWLIRRW